MIRFRKTIKNPCKNKKGFTIIELMVVTSMVAILASIAIVNYVPLKRKAYDLTALSDARTLVDSVVAATLNEEDIDYAKINTGGPVGDLDTDGNPRIPVFILSPGVEALIAGDTKQAPGDSTYFEAYVYHTSGTSDPATLSGKKEFLCIVDEANDISSLP
ncbi:MAG: prepilin-type N-terminal cleavage/methylation domain-containing protein [Desulfobacteraceae bacterium]|nr:prepilin-type N-terminal cleavage/methylation domain-containing protein [Desulfobacteraceae bacterium]